MDYIQTAKDARLKVLELVYKAQSSHIGSNFSCIDILTVLFEKMDFEKDKFICSKGWVAASVYYFMYKKGIISEDELNSYCQEGSTFIGLIEPLGKFGAEFGGGSMGFGLPAAVGYALAKKLKKEAGKVCVLMSDGEMAIGTTWEAMNIALHHKLDNLIVIVDCNGLQAMGKTKDILNIPYLGTQIDGHDYRQIEDAIETSGMINAITIKGKGVSFMEANNLYHYKNLSDEEYIQAKSELEVYG